MSPAGGGSKCLILFDLETRKVKVQAMHMLYWQDKFWYVKYLFCSSSDHLTLRIASELLYTVHNRVLYIQNNAVTLSKSNHIREPY
jgi:hypothetical protein